VNRNAKIFEGECTYFTSENFFIVVLVIFRFPKAEKFAFVEIDLKTGELEAYI
jgi:hypothetical protein